MTFGRQIAMGLIVLAGTASVHIAIILTGVGALQAVSPATALWSPLATWLAMMSIGFGTVVLGHALQILLWASAFRLTGALQTLEEATYFALVTTTTLGYGDVTLTKHSRMFGAISAVSGLLTFGFSTAFLIGVLSAVMARTA